MKAAEIAEVSRKLRIKILEMCCNGGGGHIGGAYSIIDILSVLYFHTLRPGDKLIFSKGHCCLALYTALAESGHFALELLDTYCIDGGVLHGHPKRGAAPGIEITTGSLGHGLSIAVGMALAFKMDEFANRVYCILGDGECNEGSVWEAFMSAAQLKLSNLTVIIDSNKLESLDTVENIMNHGPLAAILSSLGWAVSQINGHTVQDIIDASTLIHYSSPTVIIADTVKGKGVSFMEGVTKWHYRCPTPIERADALKELE